MSTLKKWTYTTGGFPQCLHQTSYTPPPPSSLKPTEIQIRTRAFAINPVDVQAMNLSAAGPAPSSWLPWPLSALTGGGGGSASSSSGPSSATPAEKETCCDFSGTVTHAGASAASLGYAVGDDVFGFTMAPANGLGTAGEVLTLDPAAPGVAVARKPAGWDHARAAAIPLVWLTAMVSAEAVHEAVERAGAAAGGGGGGEKWVVVLGGSSATGQYTIRIAKRRGWKVLTTCSGRNVEFVRSQVGADEVVDYTAVGSVPGEILSRLLQQQQQQLREEGAATALRGQGVVIVDCVGGTECLDHADLGPRITRYVTIVGDKTDRGSMGGPAIYSSYPRMLLRWALGRVGLGVSYDCVILEARREWLEEAGETLSGHDIVVDSTFGFDELPTALEKMVGGRVRGKLVGVLG